MKKFILFASILVLCAFAFGSYYYNKPRTTAGSVKTEYTVDAKALYNEFTSNEEEANTKYLGKAIEVSGIVAATETDASGTMTIIIDSGNDAGSISCQFEKRNNMPKVAEGDHVVVKGFCSGMLLDVVMVDCELMMD